MRKLLILGFFSLITAHRVLAQETDLGLFYGKFFAVYKYKDFGNGFRNLPGNQDLPFPSITVNKSLGNRFSGEANLSFLVYPQYTGTRLYSPGFYSEFYSINLSVTGNYSFVKTDKFEARVKAGLGAGILLEQYEGEFTEMFVYPTIDSISRGTIKRDFAAVFPTVSTGVDFTYKFAKKFKAGLRFNYQKGFFKITEYDIYYNDGSGSNDQRAKQWGNGDFYGVQLGIRYLLNGKVKK
jgi:hypothetical protein